jgi:hypothetical protein
MGSLAILGAIGMVVSVFSYACVVGYVQDPKDIKLFGKIPLVLVGVFGYASIVSAAILDLQLVVYSLVAFTALFTAYLIRRAYKIKLGCPLCPMVWFLNAFIVFVSVADILQP